MHRFLGYYAYGNAVKAPITLNLPEDGLSIFTNVLRVLACGCIIMTVACVRVQVLLFIHVMVAYLINSTVLSTAICRFIWPGLLEGTTDQRVAMRWGSVASGLMVTCFLIAILVPFFSDLMNIYSSVGIFTLSFAIPSGSMSLCLSS